MTTSKEIETIESKAHKLDVLAQQYSSIIATDSSPFSSALILARGIGALRELLTDDIMSEVMKLADTPLGFVTDRPPGGKTAREKGAYTSKDVRDAIIEAALRGYRVCGNEFNIIATRFYAAKNGLRRKVLTFPGLTDFDEKLGLPKFASSGGGAAISVSATWNLLLKGAETPIKMEQKCEFAIRVNEGQGADAILGKAQRKLYAAIMNRLTGEITPEAEVDDSIVVETEVATEPAKPEKPTLPEPTAGTWEGKLAGVEVKPYKKDDGSESAYFVLTIDNGWKASTFSESILELAEPSIGLDVRMVTKKGKSRNAFNIETFEVLKSETAQDKDPQDLPFA